MPVTNSNRTIVLCYALALSGAVAGLAVSDFFLVLEREESLLVPLVICALFAAFAVTIVLGFQNK